MAIQKTSFGRDTGLQIRMLGTMFLLGLLYVAFVGVLFTAGASAIMMVVAVGALTLAQLFLSDKLALASMGAKEVSPEEAPGLHAMIERLCIQADLPKPKIAVADTDVPNAFAMGRSQKSATVCATTGIMRRLSPAELEGVMAHELTHVKNRDVMIMTIVSFFASVASMILQFAFFGRPSALSSALMKISGAMDSIPSQDLRKAEEMNAFFIIPARAKGSLKSIFATHPPMEKRIEALNKLEAQLQAAGSSASLAA